MRIHLAIDQNLYPLTYSEMAKQLSRGGRAHRILTLVEVALTIGQLRLVTASPAGATNLSSLTAVPTAPPRPQQPEGFSQDAMTEIFGRPFIPSNH